MVPSTSSPTLMAGGPSVEGVVGSCSVTTVSGNGDQVGSVSLSGYVLFVNLIWFVPSEFITYISKLPSLDEENAILVPSADQEGY